MIRRVRAEFEQTMAEMAAAVNAAPDGHLFDASEERCGMCWGNRTTKRRSSFLQGYFPQSLGTHRIQLPALGRDFLGDLGAFAGAEGLRDVVPGFRWERIQVGEDRA